MGGLNDLDAHAQPPDALRVLFKSLQKSSPADIAENDDILDFDKARSIDVHAQKAQHDIDWDDISGALASFVGDTPLRARPLEMYEVTASPGLFIYPRLLSDEVQLALLDKILHRDLSNPQHLTNVHLFHEMVYVKACRDPPEEAPEANISFFATDSSGLLQPKDPAMHKPMSIAQMLRRKLRWITLGGQYDWTAKAYPSEQPPAFPRDIAYLLKALFPKVDAQAAIVNLYTPGDTLSVHRDVSEACDQDLVSISMGCDGIFLVGNENGSSSAAIRLHSGDAVIMSGASRYAWHAVPKVIADSCPSALANWPATCSDPRLEQWKGWLHSKRINLNVRQMKEV